MPLTRTHAVLVRQEEERMMCEGCRNNQHYLCGMQTWCTCDCAGPDSVCFLEIDPLDCAREDEDEDDA